MNKIQFLKELKETVRQVMSTEQSTSGQFGECDAKLPPWFRTMYRAFPLVVRSSFVFASSNCDWLK